MLKSHNIGKTKQTTNSVKDAATQHLQHNITKSYQLNNDTYNKKQPYVLNDLVTTLKSKDV